jgi:ribosome-associated protein
MVMNLIGVERAVSTIIPASQANRKTSMQDEIDRRDRPPSKSQLKRDAHSLQKLGTELLDIPEAEWSQLNLPSDLVIALREAKRLRSHGARKRQLQYIGKLMRNVDAEPIRQYFHQLRLKARQQAQRHQELEHWRTRLLEEGDAALQAFMALYTQANRQHLRQLIRQARKEQADNSPPKSSRALFRYIRDLAQ